MATRAGDAVDLWRASPRAPRAPSRLGRLRRLSFAARGDGRRRPERKRHTVFGDERGGLGLPGARGALSSGLSPALSGLGHHPRRARLRRRLARPQRRRGGGRSRVRGRDAGGASEDPGLGALGAEPHRRADPLEPARSLGVLDEGALAGGGQPHALHGARRRRPRPARDAGLRADRGQRGEPRARGSTACRRSSRSRRSASGGRRRSSPRRPSSRTRGSSRSASTTSGRPSPRSPRSRRRSARRRARRRRARRLPGLPREGFLRRGATATSASGASASRRSSASSSPTIPSTSTPSRRARARAPAEGRRTRWPTRARSSGPS